MSLRDNLDELDAALYDLLTCEPWAKNRAAPLVALRSDPSNGKFIFGLANKNLAAALSMPIENTWVGAGDSTMEVMGGPNKTTNQNYDRGAYVLANARMGGKMTCLFNGAVGGDTTAMLIGRINAGDFEPYRGKAKFLLLKIGVNDASTGVDFATTKANLDVIAAYFSGYAEYFVWHTNTPYGYNATIAKAAAKIADYIRYKASVMQSVILIDTYNIVVDKTASATGGIASIYGRTTESPNYMHPNAVGSDAEATEIIRLLSPLMGCDRPRFCNPANTVANWGADATQVLPNPLLLTNGGTLGGNVTSAGAGGLAGAPSDWTVRELGAAGITVGTCQLVARPDGIGNYMRVTAAAGSVVGVPKYELLTASHHADVNPGDVIDVEVTLSVGNTTSLKNLVIYMSLTDSNGVQTHFALANDGSSNTKLDGYTNAVFRTKRITLGSAITNLRIRAEINGVNKDMTGVFDFGSPVINKYPVF